jgi:hypothetical protein
MLIVDRSLETSYLTAGLPSAAEPGVDVSIRDRLTAQNVGPGDFALISTAELALLAETHRAHPGFGVWMSEAGAIVMRAPVRPDEIETASILLYHISGTAELLARATIWPYYGIKASAWTTEADGSSAITIVDGIDALEPVEAGFREDLVRAWYIMTEQPVVTHLLAMPAQAPVDDVVTIGSLLSKAFAAGYAERRDVRKALLADSSVESEQLVAFLGSVQIELDDRSRAAAYSLIARGAGGTQYPLIREIPWWAPVAEADSE